MTQETILTNATLVLSGESVEGTLVLRDGVIADVSVGRSSVPSAVNCGGDFICPGLIELHTDNLERHISPRPKVDWPHRSAILAHDRELAGTGITTVFDAIRVGSILSDGGKRYGRYARQMANEILEMRARDVLRISHHIHLRAEICSESLIDELDEFGPDDKVGIVSLMDHTPGQRQFRDLEKFESYVRGKNGMSGEGFDDYIAFLRGLQATYGQKHEAAAVAAAHRYGATLASHDDTTAEQVATSHAHGVTLAEFPTTAEAAQACKEKKIATIMGSPNLVRGGSHSGNVAAKDLAEIDALDILSSDYVPASLLQGAVKLAQLWQDLPRAIATVTSNPAASVGFRDRGEIAPGMRADVLRFAILDDAPIVNGVWCAGHRVS